MGFQARQIPPQGVDLSARLGDGLGSPSYGGGLGDGLGSPSYGDGLGDGLGSPSYGGGLGDGLGSPSYGGELAGQCPIQLVGPACQEPIEGRVAVVLAFVCERDVAAGILSDVQLNTSEAPVSSS